MPNPPPLPKNRRLDRNQAAAYLGLESRTLAKWASVGRPYLPYYRLGGKAIYDLQDLDDFLAAHRVKKPTA
jgi:hypothetical protein